MPGLPHIVQTRQEGESCYYILSIFAQGSFIALIIFQPGLQLPLLLTSSPAAEEDELFTLNFLYNYHGKTVPILSRT